MSTNDKQRYPKAKSALEILNNMLGPLKVLSKDLIDSETGKLDRVKVDTLLDKENAKRIKNEFNKYKKDPDKPATPDNLKFGMKKDYHPNGKVNKVKYT